MSFRKATTSAKWLHQIPLRVKVGTGVAIATTLGILGNLSQVTGFNLRDIHSFLNRGFSPARPTESRYQGDNSYGETKKVDPIPSDLYSPGHSSKGSSGTSTCNRVLDIVAKAASGDWASEAQAMLDIEELAKTNPPSLDQGILDQASSMYDQGVSSRPKALALIKKAFNCSG
jgi:hypothetical protein